MDLWCLMVEFEQLYFCDYVNFWSEVVGCLGLLLFNDVGEGVDQVFGLFVVNLLIFQLLLEVCENICFLVLVESVEVLVEVSDKVVEKGGKLGKVVVVVVGKVRVVLVKNLLDIVKKFL